MALPSGVPTRFDVIVVGAGPGGSAAAYLLARAGFRVVVIERGREAGSKEVYGGKIYAAPLREVWPDLDREAPIHRWVSHERISLLHGDSVVTIEYKLPKSVAFTAYLSEMARWMADRAVEAGAILVDEVVVDEIVREGERVVGVRSGPDTIYADYVIDAEGVNRKLLEALGLAEKAPPEALALGVKEVLRVGEKGIEERFGLDGGEGLAWLLAGDVTKGIPGGGFIYTMKDTVSIGLVMNVAWALKAAETGRLKESVPVLVESLRLHPYFRRFWRDADIIEYGAHLTIEDGLRYMPKRLYLPGLLVVGDAAGLLLNTGYTIRGVDYAVYSGKLAAETVIYAHDNGGPTEENMSVYEKRVRESFIYKELCRHKGIEKIVSDPLFFTKLPAIVSNALSKLYEAEYEFPTIMGALLDSIREENMSPLKLLFKIMGVVRKL